VSPRIPLLAAAALAAGCSSDWRMDMWVQPSIHPQSAPRSEPERSVPLGAERLPAGRDAAADLPNPVPASAASLARGAAIFLDRCAPCHGADGHGGGPVGRLFPRAADLAYPKVKARPDGFIWGTVTFGGEAMPSAREGLTARHRWDVVNHVRALQDGRAP
jgi:mono/diheme cytochrome c family protein